MTLYPNCRCRECKERTPGCHSFCEDYIRFRKELDEYNKEVNKKRREDNDNFYQIIQS